MKILSRLELEGFEQHFPQVRSEESIVLELATLVHPARSFDGNEPVKTVSKHRPCSGAGLPKLGLHSEGSGITATCVPCRQMYPDKFTCSFKRIFGACAETHELPPPAQFGDC